VKGASSNDFLGEGAAALADLDGDGFREIAVGGEYQQVDVYSAKSGALLRSHGAGVASFFGTAISATGDVDGDGVPDYVVGAYGGAYVYSGATGASVYGWEPLTEHFGAAVDGAGDVDGDGFCDVVVGVPLNSGMGILDGRVFVYSGQSGGVLLDLHGGIDGGEFGSTVRGGADLDGAGYPDFVVGSFAPLFDGTVFAYSGATGAKITSWKGASNDELAVDVTEQGVAFAGDLDRDGTADVLIGADDGASGGRVPSSRVARRWRCTRSPTPRATASATRSRPTATPTATASATCWSAPRSPGRRARSSSIPARRRRSSRGSRSTAATIACRPT
jgi:hypothetical protein